MNLARSGTVRFLAQKARAAAGRAMTIDAACVEKNVLCPAETGRAIEATYLPGQLERITADPGNPDLEREFLRLHGRTVEHAETAEFHFRDARLFGGSVYASGYRHYLKSFDSLPSETCREFDSAAIVSTVVGLRYFGHWLADDMTTCALVGPDRTCLSLPLPDWPDVELYCSLLDRDFGSVDNAFFRELVLFSDFSQNSLKRARYETMRRSLRSRVQADGTGGIVYLSRGQTGAARLIVNEDELVKVLEDRGVRTLSIERDTTEILLGALHDARMFITVEGSQQKHCLYALPDVASVLLIQPPRRFNMLLKGVTDCLGWPLGFVVGEDRAGGEFHVNPDEVLQTIDLLLKRM